MSSAMNAMLACAVLMSFLSVEWSSAMEGRQGASAVLPSDYDLYDRIIEDKFLTSQIQLVLLERMTVSRLMPNQPEPLTTAFVQQQRFFRGMLPQDLVRDFVEANQARSRLENRFRFGVRYRLVSADPTNDTEASRAFFVRTHDPLLLYTPTVLDRLALSRAGRTVRNDQALVYIENRRNDGTGAGFLVWFQQGEQELEIFDTEVVWTIRDTGDEAENP